MSAAANGPVPSHPPMMMIRPFSSSSGSVASVAECPFRPGGGVPSTTMLGSPPPPPPPFP